MKLKILLADDVKELSSAVGAILEHNNYNVDIVENGKEAVDKVSKNVYDCIVLDIMMPVMDGIEAIKEMRKLNIKTPIILLTAKDLVDDKVEGLDSGANDYLTKPFDKKELLARIRALTRLKEQSREKYNIGNIIFDRENSLLSKDKISLNLNSKECDILEFFIKNPERKISKEELKQRIWPNENNSDNIVLMYITYLQEKFIALDTNVKINDIDGYSLEKMSL